uniref:Uncharacterized protein hpx12 n=1 Tax=Ralstonia solanacearum TaxID=305 RepID=Q68A54_RALSL|nr:hypothetical protein [Ralstonia solanacearum]
MPWRQAVRASWRALIRLPRAPPLSWLGRTSLAAVCGSTSTVRRMFQPAPGKSWARSRAVSNSRHPFSRMPAAALPSRRFSSRSLASTRPSIGRCSNGTLTVSWHGWATETARVAGNHAASMKGALLSAQ